MKKILSCIVLSLLFTKAFAGTWSLTRMDMIIPSVSGTISSEMQSINSVFMSININFKTNIDKEIENKNNISKEILNNRAIHETLSKEIKQLNQDINQIIFLKQGITDALPIN